MTSLPRGMLAMTSSKSFFIFQLTVLFILAAGCLGQEYDCPKEYLENGDSCYQFIFYPQLTFQEAELACRRQHSYLVSVKDAAENSFIAVRLKNLDSDRHEWVTSGVRKGGEFVWTSDDTTISDFHFVSDEVKNEKRVDDLTSVEYRQIVYKFDARNDGYYWEWGRLMDPMSYICQLPKADLWKLYQQHRDFAFGTGLLDPLLWPVGPNITQQSIDTVFFKRSEFVMTPVTINCFATGNPQPTYKWFKRVIGRPTVEITGDTHYEITNGRLHIQKPEVDRDVGEYMCEASNKHGTVLSNPIRLSYGKLDEFSNVATGEYAAKLYMGVEIDCQPPVYKPDARFNWYKGSVIRFIRPELNQQLFLSRNGRLYISEVAASDAGDYFCAVYLAPRQGETLASGQPLSKNSLPIRLTVQGDNPNTYGPDIQDKFPQVFPKVPLIGQKMVLECLAYGRQPMIYNWVRTDGPMNPKAYMVDRNRVLVIEEARLQDSGSYNCIVEGVKSTSNKTRYISLSGVPSFPIPLQNQFVDANRPFTWSCLAQGIPMPTYTWYRNGKRLEGVDEDMGITVRGRHLMFQKVEDKHNGMYECEAVNALGSRKSSAQLRAIIFQPTFERRPLEETLRATAGGTLTIQCQPEAAPRPTILWTRNGGGLPAGSIVNPDGSLELTSLTTSDSGTFVCEATNSLGSASSSTTLSVSDTTVLSETPGDAVVSVNGSTSIQCRASFDSSASEIMYQWKFFNHVIEFEKEFSYSMPYSDTGSGALYIQSAQYEHEGRYTCVVFSVTDTVEQSAYLTVEGPPEEPSGVHRHKGSVNNGPHSLELWWTPGRVHRHPVTRYIVEVNSDQDDKWMPLIAVEEQESKIPEDLYYQWRRAVIEAGLSPGGSFRFRIMAAASSVGLSRPSLPSPFYKMNDAAPVFSPPNLGGGGGQERELRVTWDELPRSQWGTNNVRYVVYYRMKVDSRDGAWHASKELTKTEYHHTMTNNDYYYTPFEVKVQAVNNLGRGPNSTIATVMSAELMPKLTPKFSQANAINSTAGTVEWEQVPNKREVVFGSIFAFQVNYWLENTLCLGVNELNARFTRVYGDVTSAMVIGLKPGGDYCVNIQLLNHAGLGPKTDNFQLGMNDPAPHNYPEYVSVSSHGPDSVRVTWRGVMPRFGESPLIGYHGWYWTFGEDIRNAKVVDFGKAMTGVIHGINNKDIYKLRLMGYSNGGDGKKAPDVLFTLGSQLMYDDKTIEAMNGSPRTKPPMALALLIALIYTVMTL